LRPPPSSFLGSVGNALGTTSLRCCVRGRGNTPSSGGRNACSTALSGHPRKHVTGSRVMLPVADHPHEGGEHASAVNSSCAVDGSPHGRGEHSKTAKVSLPPSGSPPPAWGARRLGSRQASESTDYPHESGGRWLCEHVRLGLGGSPPRAWGALVCKTNQPSESGCRLTCYDLAEALR
jgi:hypothetical protein